MESQKKKKKSALQSASYGSKVNWQHLPYSTVGCVGHRAYSYIHLPGKDQAGEDFVCVSV